LRPETAQGIFTNFKNVVDTFYPDLPFGIAQQGKAFRNEISPRDFVFRSREFNQMEVEYFIALAQKKIFELKPTAATKLRQVYIDFTPETAVLIKQIEKTTNHDVKALEYYLKDKLDELQLGELKEYIHFGLTSQDVNNTAVPLLWKESLENEYYPAIANLVLELRKLASSWKNISMLARTHGQPASPTNLGKEIMVYVERIEDQLKGILDKNIYGFYTLLFLLILLLKNTSASRRILVIALFIMLILILRGRIEGFVTFLIALSCILFQRNNFDMLNKNY
jgi:hypothetical protein